MEADGNEADGLVQQVRGRKWDSVINVAKSSTLLRMLGDGKYESTRHEILTDLSSWCIQGESCFYQVLDGAPSSSSPQPVCPFLFLWQCTE